MSDAHDEDFVRFCTGWKEHGVHVADFNIKGSDDILPVLTFKDDADITVGIVHILKGGRDDALTAAMAMIPAYSAHEVVLCMDAHITNSMENPLNGREWNDTDNRMQDACDNAGACQLGLITDCLSYVCLRRDGSGWLLNDPYHVHSSDGSVHWQERDFHVIGEGFNLTGTVPEALRDFFQTPTLESMVKESGMDTAAEFGLELGSREARLHEYLGVTRMLMHDDRWMIALSAQNEEEMAVIQAAQERWKAEDMITAAQTRVAAGDAKTASGLFLPPPSSRKTR